MGRFTGWLRVSLPRTTEAFGDKPLRVRDGDARVSSVPSSTLILRYAYRETSTMQRLRSLVDVAPKSSRDRKVCPWPHRQQTPPAAPPWRSPLPLGIRCLVGVMTQPIEDQWAKGSHDCCSPHPRLYGSAARMRHPSGKRHGPDEDENRHPCPHGDKVSSPRHLALSQPGVNPSRTFVNRTTVTIAFSNPTLGKTLVAACRSGRVGSARIQPLLELLKTPTAMMSQRPLSSFASVASAFG